MRWRSKITATVTGLLLCVSSFASLCGVSCQFARMASHSCCSGVTREAPVQMVMHGGDCHGASVAAWGSTVGLDLAASAACAMCSNEGATAYTWASDRWMGGAVAASVSMVPVRLKKIRYVVRRTMDASGFHPLAVSLRV